MDNQGFVGGQTAVTGAKAVKPLRGAASHVPVGSAARDLSKQAKGAAGTFHPNHEVDKEERAINRVKKVEDRAFSLWSGEFFGGIGASVLGWLAVKAGSTKAKAGIDSVLRAPFETLYTPINKIQEIPSIYMQKVKGYSEKAGGAAAAEWAPKANAKATQLEASGAKFAADVNAKATPALQPLRSAVRDGLNSFEKTSLGSGLRNGIERITDWRAASNMKRYAKRVENLELSLTQKTPGMFDGVKKFFTGKQLPSIGAHPELAEVTGHIANVRSATTVADRVSHMNLAKEALAKLKFHPDSALVSRVEHIESHLLKSHSAIENVMHFEGLKGQGLTSMAKSFGRALGKVPVFGAIIGVGAAAGITVAVMNQRKESREAKVARNEIQEAVGANNPLMAVIDKAYSKAGRGRAAKTGLTMVGEVANGAMGMTVHGGGLGMIGMSMVPMIGTMLVPENPLLNSYANLRAEETRGVQLDPATKLMMIRQLVACMPAVASNGGMYNRLTLPVAEAIMDKNLSVKETMQLLGNDAAFGKLAAEVQAEQKKAIEAIKESAPAPGHAPIAAATGMGTKVDATHLSAGRPSLTIANAAHEGRVAQLQKAASV